MKPHDPTRRWRGRPHAAVLAAWRHPISRHPVGWLLALGLALPLAVRTVAASPSGSLRLLEGRPPAGMLNDPRGVAVSGPDGAIYAVDAAHARIQVFTTAGVPLGHWGQRGSGEADLWRPSDVAVAPDGRHVYVVDTGHRRVLRFRPTPACTTPPQAESCFVEAWGGRGNGDGLFESPVAVAVDARGRVYVADQDRNVVQVFDPTGTWLRTFGGAGSELGQLLRPTDLAVSPTGEIWVADHDNHRLQRFSPEGISRGSFEGSADRRLFRPAGVAVGPDGSFVVADHRPEGLQPRVTRYGPDRRETWRRDLLGPSVRRGGGYPQLGVAITPTRTRRSWPTRASRNSRCGWSIRSVRRGPSACADGATTISTSLSMWRWTTTFGP